MARLLIHVEGQTEESFVNEILRNHLVSKGYHSVDARIIGNARMRARRGGIRSWLSTRKDIINHLLEDPDCIATTMVDYYALPQTAPGGWPGRLRSSSMRTVEEKARCVEDAMRDDVAVEMGSRLDADRFVPFVVMHEFEGLLFSDCAGFSLGIGRSDLEVELRKIREAFNTPEEINDSPMTAPSKRIQVLLPEYQKPLFGVLAVLAVGLYRIRQECPHFNGWLAELESRAS